MKYELVLCPNEILSKVCDTVKNIGFEEYYLIKNLFSKCKKLNGVGMAAPQLGYNKNIFISLVPIPTTYINPEIISYSKEKVITEEGCLSIPSKKVKVKRCKSIKVKYTNIMGSVIKKELTGIEAIIFQHEIDHLIGKTILDYTNDSKVNR